jgi:UDP-N-acetylmuramate dehydrogenase
MNIDKILNDIVEEEQILKEEPMSRHTTFRIGGNADYFVSLCPGQADLAVKALEEQEIPYVIIGNGSNLLVGDGGFRGVVLQIGSRMNAVRLEGSRIYAQAGALLSTIASAAQKASLAGMEFASGIPGTLGGALVMNAGAYGGEMKDILESVRVLDRNGKEKVLDCKEYAGGYRTSAVQKEGLIVLEAVLCLKPGDPDEIRAKMDTLKEQRVSKQPLEYPSAGSTFKRPEGYFAGKLIMDAGLRGYQVGGAQVAEKHCGFVINKGSATAADVCRLMEDVKRKVYETSGVVLEPEVKKIGEFL